MPMKCISQLKVTFKNMHLKVYKKTFNVYVSKMTNTNKQSFWDEIKISELSQKMNVSKQAVYKWQIHGIPAKRLLEVEKLTDVRRERLRPDLYA